MSAVSSSDLFWRLPPEASSGKDGWQPVPSAFWTKRKVTIAVAIGTTLALAVLAAVLFSPIGPLAGLGLWLLAAFAGKLGLGALVTAIALPASFALPTALAEIGIAIQQQNQEFREEIISATIKVVSNILSSNKNKTGLNPCVETDYEGDLKKKQNLLIHFTADDTNDDYRNDCYNLNQITVTPKRNSEDKEYYEITCLLKKKNSRQQHFTFLLGENESTKGGISQSSYYTCLLENMKNGRQQYFTFLLGENESTKGGISQSSY